MRREEYLARSGEEGAHEAYYGQFVTEGVKALVTGKIGYWRIVRSSDPKSFNDIPLGDWDEVAGWSDSPFAPLQDYRPPGPVWEAMTNATGEEPRVVSDVVCVLKAAAREIRRSHELAMLEAEEVPLEELEAAEEVLERAIEERSRES